jgi:hypothetical protein
MAILWGSNGLTSTGAHWRDVMRCFRLTLRPRRVKTLDKSNFEHCVELEKFGAEVPGRPAPACDEAEIERLERETDERKREFDREWEKCGLEARRQNPGKDKTWIDFETENCVHNAR